MTWGYVAVAAVSVIGSAVSANASGKAADAQLQASQNSVQEQQRQYDQTRRDQAPYRAAGDSALNSISKLYGLDHTDANGNVIKGSGKSDFSSFSTSPDYLFAQQQGQLGLDRSLAARGGALSGAAVKESERFNSGLASQNFDTYYNHLAGVAGVGQTGTQATDAAGANAANQISGAYTNAGNARASAYLDQGQTIGNTANGLASNFLLNKYLNGRTAPPNAGGSPYYGNGGVTTYGGGGSAFDSNYFTGP